MIGSGAVDTSPGQEAFLGLDPGRPAWAYLVTSDLDDLVRNVIGRTVTRNYPVVGFST
jgi:hypothetical protein